MYRYSNAPHVMLRDDVPSRQSHSMFVTHALRWGRHLDVYRTHFFGSAITSLYALAVHTLNTR